VKLFLIFNVLAVVPDTPIKEPFQFPLAFTLLYVFGFIAAVIGGTLAWYNSKRPPGWEGTDRPDFVPELSDVDTSPSDVDTTKPPSDAI
jgi:hypothetical protein